MSITFVNGYQCKNCTDIDNAKKHVDPAHPQDGPYGINAANKSNAAKPSDPAGVSPPSVVYGGSLQSLNAISQTGSASSGEPPRSATSGPNGTGSSVNLSV